MGERVRVVRHEGGLLAAKEPGRDGPDALRAEAELLHRVQVPGVVELVGVEDGEDGDEPVLLTRWVGSRSLADVPVPVAPERSAAIVLAVAATVGRLHRAGVVHGDLDPTHVLLDADGRPVLCGFGSAGPIGAAVRRPTTGPGQGDGRDRRPSLRPATDVAGLGRLLEHLLGPGGGTDGGARWGRSARSTAAPRKALRAIAAHAMVDDPAGRPSVTAFAHAVRRAVPDARLLDEAPPPRPASPRPRPDARPRGRHARPEEPPARRLRSTAPALVALVAIATTTYFGLSAWWAPSSERRAAATPPTAHPTPTTTSTTHAATTTTVPSTAPVVEHDGRRYRIGDAGDVVLVGPWLCDGRDLPVVLHPDDGTVHLFPEWADEGGSITARTVATVPGADGLRATDDGTGCRDLLVTDTDQVLATLTTEELR